MSKKRKAIDIPFDELTVGMPDGSRGYMMNPYLMDKQDCVENLQDIIEAHELKMCIYEIIKETEDPELLESLSRDLTEIEFHLQFLWKFEQNRLFHREWEWPKCLCPDLDNRDKYPYERIYTAICPLHKYRCLEFQEAEYKRAQAENIARLEREALERTIPFKLGRLVRKIKKVFVK